MSAGFGWFQGTTFGPHYAKIKQELSRRLCNSQPRNQEEPKRNQRRNAAHYMTFLACQELLAEADCNITSRPATKPRRTQQNQGRNAAHYRSFSACQTLIARAKCNITSTPAPEPTGTNAEPTQKCCYLHDFRHTRNSEPTRNQAEPSPEPAS